MSRLSHHRLLKRYVFSSASDRPAALDLLRDMSRDSAMIPTVIIDEDALELWVDTNDEQHDLHAIMRRFDDALGASNLATKSIARELQMYADGGSRGNPGPSAAGYVLLDMDGNVVEKYGAYLGITTNNQAEYQALRLGLDSALRHGARTVHVYMDSMLVINQMKGIYKIRNRDLWPVHHAITEISRKLDNTFFVHVPRVMNKAADAEVNRVLDQYAHESEDKLI